MPVRARLHTLAATDAYNLGAGRTFGIGTASAFGAVLIHLSMQPSDGEVATHSTHPCRRTRTPRLGTSRLPRE